MSVLYESGTTVTKNSGISRGIGFASDGDLSPDGFGMAHTSSTGISQTIIAKKCSPPKKPQENAVVVVIVGIILLVFVYMVTSSKTLTTVGFILLVAATVFVHKKDMHDKSRWKQARQDWKNSWICLRCGKAWTYK